MSLPEKEGFLIGGWRGKASRLACWVMISPTAVFALEVSGYMTTNRLTCPRFPRLCGLCLLLLSLLCSAPSQAVENGSRVEPGDKPSGVVTMRFGQGGFILGVSSGEGKLKFKGRQYPFKLGSLGVGGFGVSKTTAVGEVYNLKRIEDFPGGYFQARAGYAAVEGKGVHWLENSNGVVIKLRATTKGLLLNLGADGLMIELKPYEQ